MSAPSTQEDALTLALAEILVNDADPSAWRRLAEASLNANRLSLAETAYKRVVELDCTDLYSMLMLGETYIAQQKFIDAKKLYLKIIYIAPYDLHSRDRLKTLISHFRGKDVEINIDQTRQDFVPRDIYNLINRDISDDLYKELQNWIYYQLSTAWDTYAAAAHADWLKKNNYPPISEFRSKGYIFGALPHDLHEEVKSAYQAMEHKKVHMQDAGPGYTISGDEGRVTTFNIGASHQVVDERFKAVIEKVLTHLQNKLEQEMGMGFRLVVLRPYDVFPEAPLYGLHYDGWPLGLTKMFIYPYGASESKGSTDFYDYDGNLHIPTAEPGGWVLFEQSTLYHTVRPPQEGVRGSIELTFAPAFETDLRVTECGSNCGPPTTPFIHLEDKAWAPRMSYNDVAERMKRRSIETMLNIPRRAHSEPHDGV